MSDLPAEAICTPEQAAAMDFEPMVALDLMSGPEFIRRASQTYNVLLVVTRLMQLGPDDMADALWAIDPENPTSVLEGAIDAKAWLQGLADVIGCAEARMMIAVSKRALQ